MVKPAKPPRINGRGVSATGGVLPGHTPRPQDSTRDVWSDLGLNGGLVDPSDVEGAGNLISDDLESIVPRHVVFDSKGVLVHDPSVDSMFDVVDPAVPGVLSASIPGMDAIAIWNDESDEHWDSSGRGYGYGSPMALTSSVSTDPADISDYPTSTINPDRPRTVAAGYDASRKTLTVVFRDGTFYNYYEVANLQWQNFRKARSKGRYILRYLNGKPRGAASVSGIPDAHRELLYRMARTAQIYQGGLQRGQSAKSLRGKSLSKHYRYQSGNLGGTGRKRAKMAASPPSPPPTTPPKII
jgi:hypothetical protein